MSKNPLKALLGFPVTNSVLRPVKNDLRVTSLTLFTSVMCKVLPNTPMVRDLFCYSFITVLSTAGVENIILEIYMVQLFKRLAQIPSSLLYKNKLWLTTLFCVLASKTKKQIFVSYNLQNTDSNFTLLIENRIKEEMTAFPEKFWLHITVKEDEGFVSEKLIAIFTLTLS